MTYRPLIFVAALFFLFAPLVFAPSPGFGQEGGMALLKKGEEAYYQGKLGEARQALLDALAALSDNKGKASASILLGMVEVADGKPAAAEERFSQAALLDPKRKLSSSKYPPNVIALYNKARARHIGSVSIQTTPSDAEVFLDGKLLGLTPVNAGDLLAGDHSIKIVRHGYKTETKVMTVRPAERTQFFLDLAVDDQVAPLVESAPLMQATEGRSIRVKARITDDLGVASATLFYRRQGNGAFDKVAMRVVAPETYEGVIPRNVVTAAGVEYYIAAYDLGENETLEGSADLPRAIRIVAIDREPPQIFHTPLLATSDASEQSIKVTVRDNTEVAYGKIFYKKEEDDSYFETSLANPATKMDHELTLPKELLTGDRIFYYIEAADTAGNVSFDGRRDTPHRTLVYRTLPYKEGYIVERKTARTGALKREVTINVGTLKGYQKDQVFTTFNASEKVTDPETGMVLAINQKLTGKIKIVSPGPVTSVARIISETDKGSIATGDLFRARPGPPQNVGGYSPKFRQNVVTWKMSAEPEVKGYHVYKSESREGPYEEIGKVSGRDRTELKDSGSRGGKLVDGKRYYYKVAAYNQERQLSDRSAPGFVVAKGGPDPPTGLQAVSGEIRKIPLTWTRSGDKEAVGYYVERSESREGEYIEIAILDSSSRDRYTDSPNLDKGHQVEDNKTYWYRVVSYNRKNKFGNPTEPVSGTSRKKPDAPSELQVAAVGVRSVSLEWTPSSDPDVTGYRIMRADKQEGPYDIVRDIRGRDEAEFTDEDRSGDRVADGTRYFYKVASLNAGKAESEFLGPAEATTFGPPHPPGGVVAASGQVKSVTLNWTAPDDPSVSGYVVYRAPQKGAELTQIKKLRGKTSTSYVDNGSWNKRLLDGTGYYYVVRSHNDVGVESVQETGAEAVTKPRPLAVAGVATEGVQAGRATVSWLPNTEPDIVGYRVSRSDKEEGSYRTVSPQARATIYDDEGLENGATYWYRIEAIDKDNLVGDPSSPVMATTKPAPAKPDGLTIDTVTTSSITLSWSANRESDIDRYEIMAVGFFGSEKVATSAGTSHTLDGLKPNSTYTYSIRAVDADGLVSDLSTPVKGVTAKE